MKIVHIADVHWRGLTRHAEYRRSFTDMFEQCRDINPDCFVIAGDIVHSKTQGISPELIDCLNWWFTEMSSIAPVHVMLGNHDGLVLNTDRQDAISPILRALNLRNVHLYRKSAVYPDPEGENINWCVFSPFDLDGWSSIKPTPGKINIALYHGAVWGSHTDTDWMLDGDCKMDLFKTFDFTMLGDIHKRQQIDADGRIWYCGSTIQQNYGESGEKGFLLWDISGVNDWSVDFYPVTHHNPFVTVDFLENIQATVKECDKWPDGSRFRIRSYKQLDPKTQRKLSTVLRRVKSADEVVFKIDPKSSNDLGIDEATANKVRIENLSKSETHKNLLREYYGEETESNEFWEEVDKILDDIVPKASGTEIKGNSWSVQRMTFDNTFGYGSDNSVDFTKLNGIIGIFGKNRCGKSSIPGTLMYGLYNTNDRGISSLLHVVNTRKPFCAAEVTFSVNGKLYRLERQTVRHKAKKRAETTVTHLNLYEVDEDGSILKDLSGEQRRETEESIRKLIGTSDEFMMTSFAAQGNMNAFISKGSTERKRILSNFLGLDVFDSLHSLVKEEATGIKVMLKRLQVKDWVQEIRNKRIEIKSQADRREELQAELEQQKSNYNELKDIAERDYTDSFVDPRLISSKERTLITKQRQYSDLGDSVLTIEESIELIEERIEKYEIIKQQFPIEGLKRRLKNLDELKLSLSTMKARLNSEKRLLSSQTKSVRLLAEVPCGDNFPTCKFIKDSHKNKSLIEDQRNLVNDLNESVLSSESNVEELESEGLRNKIDKYASMLNKESSDRLSLVRLESDLTDKNTRMTILEQEIASNKKELSELKLRASNNENEELLNIRRQMKLITEKINEINTEIVSNAEQTGRSRSMISQLRREQTEYDRLQVEWKVYDFLIKATSWRGIPTYIMSKQIPVINAELSTILQDTTGFTIELEVDERNTDVFLNYGDSRRPIECASGMEKMVSSLALRVALSNVSHLNKSDMFIVDEGFGTLDPQNVEAVTSLLHRLKKFYKQILIISHVDVVKDVVDEVIEITKKGPDSLVVYG
tara:strand:+ start:3646 stop:6777 length:3132 start_codon:yes stop_codon:yes gene_type:complete